MLNGHPYNTIITKQCIGRLLQGNTKAVYNEYSLHTKNPCNPKRV